MSSPIFPHFLTSTTTYVRIRYLELLGVQPPSVTNVDLFLTLHYLSLVHRVKIIDVQPYTAKDQPLEAQARRRREPATPSSRPSFLQSMSRILILSIFALWPSTVVARPYPAHSLLSLTLPFFLFSPSAVTPSTRRTRRTARTRRRR